VLLPEWIHGRGIIHDGLLHVIPGSWRDTDRGTQGRFMVAGQLAIDVQIETSETGIQVVLGVTNAGSSEITDVWANICTPVNHLPGSPGWSNADFIPAAVPLDRALQGRFWFEVLTPTRLSTLTESGWVPMHPCPDRPDASSVPLYSFVPSVSADAWACALESPAAGLWFYQAWDTPCRWCTPCPGNACMHLEPFVAERLLPGTRAAIRGWVGMHHGDRPSLRAALRALGQREVPRGAGSP